MTTIRTIIIAATLLALAACGSGGGNASPDVPRSPGDATHEAEAPPETAKTSQQVNDEFTTALDAAGLETCSVEQENSYTNYVIAPCEDEGAEQYTPGATVDVSVYRSAEAQQEDLAMKKADLGLKGWTWGNATVTLLDQNPEREVVKQLDAMMDDLGGVVEFDGTSS